MHLGLFTVALLFEEQEKPIFHVDPSTSVQGME